MITITPNPINSINLSIVKEFNQYAIVEETELSDMHMSTNSSDNLALDLAFSINCKVAIKTYSSFESIVREKHYNGSIISMKTSYTLFPQVNLCARDIYLAMLNAIDRLQETVNIVFKYESCIPVVNVFSRSNLIDQANKALIDYYNSWGNGSW